MKEYKFTYTFDPETAEYFDDSLRNEEIECQYTIAAGHPFLNYARLYYSAGEYIDILPILLAFKGAKELERAAYNDYQMRQYEKVYKAYPTWNNNPTQEELVEMLKLK